MSKPPLKQFCEEAKTIFLPTILRIVRDKDKAADIFQQTMLYIISEYPTIEDPVAFGWKTIHHLKLNSRRSDDRGKMTQSLSDEERVTLSIASHSDDPEYILAYEEYNKFLNKALQQLPKEKHDLALDYLTKGLKYDKKKKAFVAMDLEEFCEVNNVSRSLLYKILKELQDQMIAFMNHGRK